MQAQLKKQKQKLHNKLNNSKGGIRGNKSSRTRTQNIHSKYS